MTLREHVRGELSQFSPQERRVARVLLADYPRAALGTSAELAATAGVSAPTVVRFARSLGYSGYPALQEALLNEISERAASPITQYRTTRDRNGVGHWFDAGLAFTTKSIERSLTAIPKAEVESAVDLLADPKLAVTAVGGRYSGHIAEYLALHLRQMRPNVRSRSRSDTLSIDVSDVIDASRRNVFVIYDFRRYQTVTVERSAQLAEAGARIICITDEWLSPVAQVAQVVLPTSVHSPGPFDSIAAALVLTELLIDAVLERLGPDALARMRRWEEASAHEVMD
jgi:DNA-binding MurR/RpiR family transcriptional regulator